MFEKDCPIPEPFSSMVVSILVLTFLFFMVFISRFIFAPLMPTISGDLGLSHGQAGSIFLIGSIGTFIGSLFSGFVSSRINHRGNLIVSMFGVGLAMFIASFFASLWAIRLTMFMLGLAAGLNLPSNLATITAMVSREDWGKALAVQQLGPPLSLVLGPLITIAFLVWFSWKGPLVFLALFAIAVGLLYMKFGKSGGFPGDVLNTAAVKVVAGQKSFWIMIILFALGMGGQVGIYAMLPLYLVDERSLDGELANTLIGIAQISALFMTFFSGWVTDKIGEKRAIALFLVASGIVTILLGVLTGTWLKVIVFLQPALIVCFFPPAFAALSRTVQPNMRSIAAALAPPMGFVLGGGIFPAALGYMGQNFSFSLGIILAGCIIILGSGLVIFLRLLEKMDDGC
jgi:NNP family nitrate/nitrite transporter-like MFS transporter